MAPPPGGAAPLPTSILHKKRSPRGLKVQLPSELEPEPEPEPTAAQRSLLSASPKDLARSLSEGKSSSPPASPSAGGAALVRTNTKEEEAIMQGMTLLLHKKQGAAKPHSRFFWFEKTEGQPGAIYWAKKPDAKRGHGRRKRAQVRAVRWGLGAEVKGNRERALQREKPPRSLPESVDERAFRVLTSVKHGARSSKQYAQLTLEADSPAEAELWVSGISQTLSGTLAQVAISPSSSRGRTLTGKRRSDLGKGFGG